MISVKLSQEHLTLPLAELDAVLESCYPDKKLTLQISENTVNITELDDESVLRNRLAYAMEINGVQVEQGFDARYPKNRPFTYPTTLDPKLARCMVNLARAGQSGSGAAGQRAETTIFDPFCGTGGILLEAGLMGFKTIGIDIDEKMIEGCKKNLDFYEVEDYDISVNDFFKTKKRGIIVTDPPYGKSTSLPGKNLEDFYNMILEKLHEITTGISCIGSPSTINLGEMAVNQGFKLKEEHIFFVNNDLSKRIVVLQK
jgi:tRNA (guanine10-N2)-dimethyltransferase